MFILTFDRIEVRTPMSMEQAFKRAVENIARHGDTDVFPFPIENHVLYDRPDEAVAILMQIHKDLDGSIADFPPIAEGMLSAVGYTGFRWATQVDPIWNAYLLGLVISIAPEIEAARLPIAKGNVFSYRFEWDDVEKSLFNRNIGWIQFQQTSVERAREKKFVLSCDISDFYPRIYHHRLENALEKATNSAEQCRRIMKLLMHISKNVSYGLPVGGPAARLLSELLLNRVDRLLTTSGVEFCRFADDYHIFADSAEDAYKQLLFLSEKLVQNEGLLLQKAKTRVMSSEEFLSTSEFAEENVVDNDAEQEARDFLRLRLHYDPYSQSADADYEALSQEVAKFDILGMLGREMRKTRVHQSLARKLISALRLLEAPQRDAAIISLMENLQVLYPVYPSIMILIKTIVDELDDIVKTQIFQRLRSLIASGAHIVQVPTHLAYTVRVLAHDRSEEADETLSTVYGANSSSAIRRDVILAMAKRDADFWISDVRNKFATVTDWEKTAILVSSFDLGDEGDHWRRSVKRVLTPMQGLVRDWALERVKDGKFEIPL